MAQLASEQQAVVAVIDPDVLTAATYDSTWVDMGLFPQVQGIVMAGTLGASATMDGSIVQATDSSGTGAKAITGKAITQFTQAGTDSDKQAVINVRADELDVAGDFTHVALRIVVAVATSDGAGIVMGTRARYQPANLNDVSTVDEIVS